MTYSRVTECRFKACFMVLPPAFQYPGNEPFAFFAIYKNLDKNPNLKHTAKNFLLEKEQNQEAREEDIIPWSLLGAVNYRDQETKRRQNERY